MFRHDELGIGQQADRHHLTFRQSVLGECLPLVRVYVACALRLLGDAAYVDTIKAYLESRKVNFLFYEDFDSPAPCSWNASRSTWPDYASTTSTTWQRAKGNPAELS